MKEVGKVGGGRLGCISKLSHWTRDQMITVLFKCQTASLEPFPR